MLTTRWLILATFLLGSLCERVEASSTSIGAFFDSQATDCDATVAPYTPFVVYICALLGADAPDGMTGAQFRVDGLSGVVTAILPNPEATTTLGDPTVSSGCAIVFPNCVTGDGPRRVVPLYTIDCFASEFPVLPRTVTVARRVLPCDSGCCRLAPCIWLCDAPVFSSIYVAGGQALINNGSCAIEVQPAAWSKVKSLFTANPVLQPPAPYEDQR